MIKKGNRGKYAVIEVKGKLMGGPETVELYDCLDALMLEGKDWIIFDLGDVQWINSAGIGALISSYVTIAKKKGIVKFANLSDKVKDVLKITKLNMVLDIYETLDSAAE